MFEFKDSKGGTWEISLTFGTVMRVKSKSGNKFNLLDPGADNLADRLLNDLGEFWDMLWHLVDPIATSRGVSPEQFGQTMASDCVHVAQDKFFAEWALFCRGLQREDWAIALETMIGQKTKAMKKLQSRIETEMKHATDATDQAIDLTLNKEFGKLRDSLASILAASKE